MAKIETIVKSLTRLVVICVLSLLLTLGLSLYGNWLFAVIMPRKWDLLLWDVSEKGLGNWIWDRSCEVMVPVFVLLGVSIVLTLQFYLSASSLIVMIL